MESKSSKKNVGNSLFHFSFSLIARQFKQTNSYELIEKKKTEFGFHFSQSTLIGQSWRLFVLWTI